MRRRVATNTSGRPMHSSTRIAATGPCPMPDATSHGCAAVEAVRGTPQARPDGVGAYGARVTAPQLLELVKKSADYLGARGIGNARREAEWIFAEGLGLTRLDL